MTSMPVAVGRWARPSFREISWPADVVGAMAPRSPQPCEVARRSRSATTTPPRAVRLEPGSDDAGDLGRASAGDEQALGRLYDRHAGAMLAVARRYFREVEDASDLVHDVFIEAWQRAHSFDPRRASVRAWLLLRVRSRCVDRIRRGRVRDAGTAAFAAEPPANVPTTAAMSVDADRLTGAVARLDRPFRQVLELAYFRGMTCREIATRCELPEGTVKSRLAAGMRRLRGQLAANGNLS